MGMPPFAKQLLLALGCLAAIAGKAAPAGAPAPFFAGRHYPIVTDGHFPADEFILAQSRFWYAIYVETGENEGLLHDPFNPELVLRKVKVPENYSKAGRKAVEFQVKTLQGEILALISKDSAAWTPQERNLKALFPADWDSTALALCAERLRFQRGLKNKFRAGVERSYRYLPTIDSIFSEQGLPARLKYLPHVESSFYPHAYSKVGAAGMWQFMKSSSRRTMKVGYLVDERRDPVASTRAAAKMLAYNHAYLKHWPLAVMAYNHGPGGVARAVRGTRSNDLGTIIKSYYSNSFGFASKNFYAEFLAASSIAMKADSIYPNLVKLEPLHSQTLLLGKAYGTKFLCAVTGLSPEELEEYNLSLRPATFRGNAQLPKGFPLNLPLSVDVASLTRKMASGEVLASRKTPGKPSGGPLEVAMADATGETPVPRDKVENRASEGPAASAPKQPGKAPRKKKASGETADPKAGAGIIAAGAAPEEKAAPRGAARSVPRDTATMARALASAMKPPAPPPASEQPHVVDSNFALQTSDLDKLAHPMDRFNASIYNLGYQYAKGALIIQVGTEETISHYSEWAFVPEKKLRGLNRIRAAGDLRMGRSIRIPLSEEKAEEFLRKREEYYRAIEEDFYNNYHVSGTEPLRVEKGMNLWTWAYEREIPFWLIQKHNVGKALNEVRPGDTVSVPLIETGIRKWGFTRYGNSRDYLAGISRFLLTGKTDTY